MEEDVLGPRSEITGATYVTCAHCGRLYPERATVPVEAGVLEHVRSEYENLCPDCIRELERHYEEEVLTEPAEAEPEEAPG
ncbi:MAG: hypothetical protein HY320_12720 [Armatimonadetes bacterium]|nr:hypothetical protein [Armatimonadota bacterium]